jgi:hypothetical protein
MLALLEGGGYIPSAFLEVFDPIVLSQAMTRHADHPGGKISLDWFNADSPSFGDCNS